jgi:hypothetical protein
MANTFQTGIGISEKDEITKPETSGSAIRKRPQVVPICANDVPAPNFQRERAFYTAKRIICLTV